MSFYRKSLADRKLVLGDIAEPQFEKWAARKGIEIYDFGIKRPPFKRFYDLPLTVRSQPDYVCEGSNYRKFFVEVKGTGGTYVRIKKETIETIAYWNGELTVWFFIYDSNKHRAAFLTYRKLVTLCSESKMSVFDDGKEYYKILGSKFEWEQLPMEDKNDRRDSTGNESDERGGTADGSDQHTA